MPVVDVITGGLGSRHGGRELSSLDDGSSTFLDSLKERIVDIDEIETYADESSLKVSFVVDSGVGINSVST